MADDGRLRVNGLRELISELRKIDADFPGQVRQINRDAAEQVSDTAKTLVPRRSGTLAGSIRPLASQRAGQVATGSGRVPYAGPIHFGWRRRNIRPQPFLYDALDVRREEIFEAYEQQIEQLVDRVMRG